MDAESGERDGKKAAAAAKMHWVRIMIGGFLAVMLLLLGIPVAMKWGQTRWISSETRPATVDAAEG